MLQELQLNSVCFVQVCFVMVDKFIIVLVFSIWNATWKIGTWIVKLCHSRVATSEGKVRKKKIFSWSPSPCILVREKSGNFEKMSGNFSHFTHVRELSGNFVMSCQGIVRECYHDIIFRLKPPDQTRVSTDISDHFFVWVRGKGQGNKSEGGGEQEKDRSSNRVKEERGVWFVLRKKGLQIFREGN